MAGRDLDMTFAALWRVDLRRYFEVDPEYWATERRVYVAMRFGMRLVPGKLTITQYPGNRYIPGKYGWSVGSSLEKVPTRLLFNTLDDYGHRDGEDWDEVEAMISAYFDCRVHGGFWGRCAGPGSNDRVSWSMPV